MWNREAEKRTEDDGDGGGHAEVQLPEQSGQQVVFGPSRSIYLYVGTFMLGHKYV